MKKHDVISALADVAPLPNCSDEPTFSAPWQAQAFALTVATHEKGLFTWSEWAACFSKVLAKTQGERVVSESSYDDDGYYEAWLSALGEIMAAKQVADQKAQSTRQAAWERATLATPHGEPILLSNDPLSQPI